MLVIFFSTELNFWRYHENFFEIFYKNEVRVIVIAPMLKDIIYFKKDQKEITINETCVITNFQTLNIPKDTIKIIHPRKNGQLKKTELHMNGKKEDIYTMYPKIKN